MERHANFEIADMSGSGALPRRSGELAFHDEWERRAFALAVVLSEQGEFVWDEFRQHLIASIAATGETPAKPRVDGPGYYEHWLAALEKTLSEKGVIG